tara:strand:- start:2000 stop:2209 length:210 start_codon:yes stop_codon:yes gene_type:complete
MQKTHKPISEKTDRELKEGLYKNIRNISSLTRNTNGWIRFFGVLIIIPMGIALLYYFIQFIIWWWDLVN